LFEFESFTEQNFDAKIGVLANYSLCLSFSYTKRLKIRVKHEKEYKSKIVNQKLE